MGNIQVFPFFKGYNMITSRTNQTVKLVNRLKKKKNRDKEGLFIIEGKKFADDAVRRNLAQKLIVTEKYADAYPDALVVSDEIFSYISETKTPQGVIALARMKEHSLDEIRKGANVLYLDDIQDPGNAGTLARTAACAGFEAIIVSDTTTDLFSPKAMRASAGNVLAIPVIKDTENNALETLRKDGYEIIASCVDGSEDAMLSPEYNVLIVGNEGRGISDETLEKATVRVRIPMKKEVESLNAAVSGSILMYKINGYL